MTRHTEMTEAEFDAEFAHDELLQQCAFVKKWLRGINVRGVAGSDCGFFLYCNDKEHAIKVENQLNERGLYHTDIHLSHEPDCGQWVCQVSERDTFNFTGGKYDKIVNTLVGLCKSLGHQAKYVYVDCNIWVVQLKDEKAAIKLAKDMSTRIANAKVTLVTKYETTFEIKIEFGV
jgi:hypothetical protein